MVITFSVATYLVPRFEGLGRRLTSVRDVGTQGLLSLYVHNVILFINILRYLRVNLWVSFILV